MDSLRIVAVSFTAVGFIIMAASLLRTRRILALMDGRPRRASWRLLQLLISFFLIAYVVTIPFMYSGSADTMAVMVGTIFFAGAIFVGVTITVSLRTIDDLMEKESALVVARDEALEASRMKTALLTSVTHELRTPLQAILGYEEMLLAGVYGPVTADQASVIGRLEVNARRLLTQINNLLAQAALEDGESVTTTRVRFVPAEILQTVESTLYPLAREKQLALRACVEDDVPATLYGDPEKLQDIALNLAGNALKFTRKGSVEIAITRPDVKHRALRVADTGPGIPGAARDSILKPFQRAGNLLTHTQEGMGLGLALVHKWTNIMGGELQLESAVGKGTTFTVLFPLNGAGVEV